MIDLLLSLLECPVDVHHYFFFITFLIWVWKTIHCAFFFFAVTTSSNFLSLYYNKYARK
jgi:hypothetical protein